MKFKTIISGAILASCMFALNIVASAREAVYPSVQVFTLETVNGSPNTSREVATSAAYNIDGVTSIGFDFLVVQGTSTPFISIGYQTSMNNSTWTATTVATNNTSAIVYTATDSAITVPPTEWIRWILRNELGNAVDTTVSVLFKRKKE